MGLFVLLDLATWLLIVIAPVVVSTIVILETLHWTTEAEASRFETVLGLVDVLRFVLVGALVARWLRSRSGASSRVAALPTVLTGAAISLAGQAVVAITTVALTAAAAHILTYLMAPVLVVGCTVLGAVCVSPSRAPSPATAPAGYVNA